MKDGMQNPWFDNVIEIVEMSKDWNRHKEGVGLRCIKQYMLGKASDIFSGAPILLIPEGAMGSIQRAFPSTGLYVVWFGSLLFHIHEENLDECFEPIHGIRAY